MNFKKLTMDELENNPKALSKILLAYWISIPSDTKTVPTKIVVTKIKSTSYSYNKMDRDNVCYGLGSIKKASIETYIDKVKYMNEQNKELFESTEGGKHYGSNN